MRRNYGIPFKGSKNPIVKELCEALPKRRTFVDMFCGGCTVTDYAESHGLYENYIINDIDSWKPRTFLEAMEGKLTIPTEFCTREMLAEYVKDPGSHPVEVTCFSFSNDTRTYFCSKKIENWRHAVYDARTCTGTGKGLFVKYGLSPERTGTTKDVREHFEEYDMAFWRATGIARCEPDGRERRIRMIAWCEPDERERRIGMIARCQPDVAERRIGMFSMDYAIMPLPAKEDCAIYCDIPYINTNTVYVKAFDFERFYAWAHDMATAGYDVYVSAKTMPEDRFRIVSVFDAPDRAMGRGNGTIRKDILWKAV